MSNDRTNGDGVQVCREEADIIEDIRVYLPSREECLRAKQLLGLAEMAIEKLERALTLEHELNAPHRREHLWNTVSAWAGMALIGCGAWMLLPAAAPIVCGVMLIAGVIYAQSGGGN